MTAAGAAATDLGGTPVRQVVTVLRRKRGKPQADAADAASGIRHPVGTGTYDVSPPATTVAC